MTREQKLALILGFALTLVVGVLISDHLSGARAASTPELTEALTPSELPRPGMGRETTGYAIVPRETPVVEETFAINTPSEQLVKLEQPPTDSTTGFDAEQFARAFNDWTTGNSDLPTAARIDTITMGQSPSNRGTQPEVPKNDPIRDITRTATQPVDATRELIHRVQKGDTLWSIAQRYYADGSQWQRIADRNKDRMMSNGQVRAGSTIVIPGVPATGGQRPVAYPNQVAQIKTYTVRRGDTLGEISMKTLGTSRRWREILELNKDRINDPDSVPVGVELRLPSA